MNRLENSTVIVTGGGSGIGAATARRIVEEGAAAVIVDRDVAAGRRIASELGGVFYEADLADRASISALCERLGGELSEIHGLVNNAGLVRPTPFESMTDENWDVQLAILLTAPAFLVRGLLPSLERGHASVVNISSEGGFRPRATHTAYDASKAGIAALARSLAAELGGRNIRVNSIAPGWIASEMHFGTGPDAAAKRQALLERENSDNILNRLGRPEEIASVVAFLLSADASFLTGTCIHADGGMGLG
jgi:NAD(P)-dependent dehydrogenase (short-subunit alcohol dehydrogenase family)